MKSLLKIPVKVEMSEVQHTSDHALTIEELSDQIEEARKGKARVDSKYVMYDNQGRHLFDYKLDYFKYLDNISYVIKKAKERKAEKPNEVYKNSHEMIIQ